MREVFFAIFLATQAWGFESALKGVTVKFGGVTPSLEVKAQNKDTSGKALEYRPSTQAKTFLGVDYKNYGLSLSTFNPRTTEFRKKYGEGRSLDFQFRFSYDDFYVETFYQQYKGYYLHNAKSVMTNPIGVNGEFPRNGNMKLEHYEVQISKFLDSEKFHPSRAFEFTDKPSESGGTWYVMGGVNSQRIRTPISLVPNTATGNYAQLDNFRGATSSLIYLGGGGAYSYVFNSHWIASGLLGVAWGSQWTRFNLTNEKQNNNVGNFKSQVKIAFGYSGEEFLSGIIIQGDTTQIDQQELKLELSTVEGSFFIGWRF